MNEAFAEAAAAKHALADGSSPLSFIRMASNGAAQAPFAATAAVIAGWAARDEASIEAHIRELEEIGVARPRATPMFYRVAASLLTCAPSIQVAGGDTSGEVEPVYVMFEDGLWIGLGSDHTDRKLETVGVTLSKQVCAKPVAPELWRHEDVADHWDTLILRSTIEVDGERRLYQEGTLAALRTPGDLLQRFEAAGGKPAAGMAMFGGTLPVIGGLTPSDAMQIELEDPVVDRRLTHTYRISALPIAD